MYHWSEIQEQKLKNQGTSRHLTGRTAKHLNEERGMQAEMHAQKVAELRLLVTSNKATIAQQEMFMKHE